MSVVYPKWRPRNETSDDLDREREAAGQVQRVRGVEVVKLSEGLYGIDWALVEGGGRLVAWGEFKARKRRYDTLLLSAAKWEHGCRLAREFGVPFVVFVRWEDGLFCYPTNGFHTYRPEIGGNNRGQNGDIEPCVHLPTAAFKRLPE